MIATTPKLNALEQISNQLFNIPEVSAVTITSGRRTTTYGEPVGPPRTEWAVGARVRISVWGEPAPLIDATMELARLIELREQEIDELADALTQANDRQLKLYELTQVHLDTLDRDATISLVLKHAVDLTNSDHALLVSDATTSWVESKSETVPLWLSTKASDMLAGDKGASSDTRQQSRRSLAVRFRVDTHTYVLALGREIGDPFGTAERKILDALAASLGSAMQLVALHESALTRAVVEHEHATAVQLATAVMPKSLPEVAGMDIHASTVAARSVGGDFYSAIEHNGTLRFVVGDVAGKGLPAAVLMTNALTVTHLEFNRIDSDDPCELLIDIAEGLDPILRGTNRFITMLVGTARRIENSPNIRVSLANAGHSPVLLSVGGVLTAVPPIAPPVGVTKIQAISAQHLVLCPGDTLIVGSDGLLEQDDHAGDLFGHERLSELLSAGSSAADLVEEILEAVGDHAGDQPRSDDQTIFVLRPESVPEMPSTGSQINDGFAPQTYDAASDESFSSDPFHLTIEANSLAVRALGDWIADVIRTVSLPIGAGIEEATPGLATTIELALHEVCINIVEHAYGPTHGSISLTAAHDGSNLCFVTNDDGKEFDQTTLVEPDSANPTVRGYGLMITKQLASSVSYARVESRNIWSLTFPLFHTVDHSDQEEPSSKCSKTQQGISS